MRHCFLWWLRRGVGEEDGSWAGGEWRVRMGKILRGVGKFVRGWREDFDKSKP